MSRLQAVIFDLDGVLADTAGLHFRAWKRLADHVGRAFTEDDNAALKGVDRMGSLALILGGEAARYTPAELQALAALKNGWYVESIAELGPADVLPGAREALEAVKAAGLKTALASASRNAPALTARLGIDRLLDFQADAGAVASGKPAPDIFLAAAAGVDTAPARCLGVEDSAAGVAAINAAGMASLGVGEPAELAQAGRVIGDMTAFRLADYLERSAA